MYELSKILESLRRRRRFALALFIVLVIIGAGAVMLLPRTYSTSSEVLIKRPDTQSQSTAYPQIDALLASNRATAIETYVALAQQPAIAERVIRQLGLKTQVKELLNKNIVVKPLTNSDILDVAVDWTDPAGSAAIANAFAHAFVDRQRELAASQAAQAATSLSVALNKAQGDLAKADDALTLFESQRALDDPSAQTASILSAIGDIQAKERATAAERVQAEGQLSSIGTQLGSSPTTINANEVIGSSPVTDQLAQQLAQQRLQLSLLRRQFTDNYPDVIAAKKQVASLEAQLAAAPRTKLTSRSVEPNPLYASLRAQQVALQAQVQGDSAQLVLLSNQEATLVDRLRAFPTDVTNLASLQRQAKSAEAIYQALQNSYFNAVVAQSMAVSDLSIVQEADPALATVRPPRLPALLAVIGVALLATLAIVVLLDSYASSSLALSEAR
jgi:polysaccharide biosynthesis transport protein